MQDNDIQTLKPVTSTRSLEISKESIKPVDLEAEASSITLDVNKEPIKAIDLFLFAYGSLRADETVEAARDSVRFFLKANRTLDFEGFGKVEPSTLLEAIQDWSSNYEESSKFKPSITTFFRKKLYRTALYNFRAKKVAEARRPKKVCFSVGFRKMLEDEERYGKKEFSIF